MTEEKIPSKGVFSLVNYKIPKFEFNEPEQPQGELELAFHPSGQYNSEKSEFLLKMEFKAFENDSKIKDDVVRVHIIMESVFKFASETPFEKIPDYFYPNGIAITFPYIRAAVSNLTLQSNIGAPIILPTYNLSVLGDVLKRDTTAV